MRRREFIALVAGLAGCPLSELRSEQRRPVIGFLSSSSPGRLARFADAFRRGLADAGYLDGSNIAVEFRWAEGHYDRLPALAAELVRLEVDVIVAHGVPAGRAAKQATTRIPIVMAVVGDPIATGLVHNLARPEGNLTGSSFFIGEVNVKRLELLKEVFPRIVRVAALSNPDNPISNVIIPALQSAAVSLGLTLEVANTQGPTQFDGAFAAIVNRSEAVVIDGLRARQGGGPPRRIEDGVTLSE